MVTQDSNLIANVVATPPTLTDVGQAGGRVRVMVDSFEMNAAGSTGIDADGDILRMCRLPSNARILQLWVSSDDLDSGTDIALNYGIYKTDGTLVDEDEFAAAVNHQSAVAKTDLMFEAAVTDISNWQATLWERAGESTDPSIMYDICATNTAATSGLQAATFAFMILYTVD